MAAYIASVIYLLLLHLLLVGSLLGLHGGEQKNLLDGVGVGQEHGESINTASPSGSRGKTVLEGSAEGLVDHLGLVVSGILLSSLLLESLSLVKGIVQLGVGVTDLLGGNKDLESLTDTGSVSRVLGQRRHHLGVAVDKGGVDARVLKVVANQLVQHSGVGERRSAGKTDLLELILQELVGLGGVELVSRRELDAQLLLKSADDIESLPGSSEVDGDSLTLGALGLVLNLVSSGDLLDHLGEEQLGGLHEIVDVGVGLVELTGGELGVMGLVNTLVSELSANLVDSLHSSNNKLLEVQLGGNSHVHVQVEVVVVGDKGLGGGSSSNDVHHGGLDLNEVLVVQELSDVLDDLGSHNESLSGGVVHDQIQVSLSESGLDVLESGLVGRQHMQRRSQQNQLLAEDGKLALTALLGLSSAGVTSDTNDISSSDKIVDSPVSLVVLALGHDLHGLALLMKHVESQLGAGSSQSVDSASNRDLLVLFDLSSSQTLVLVDKLIDLGSHVELVGVRVGGLGLSQSVNLSRSDLKVLVGGQLLLVGALLLLLGLGLGGGLLGLLLGQISQLLSLLELGLGDLLAGLLVEIGLGKSLGGFLDIRHVVVVEEEDLKKLFTHMAQISR